MYDIVTIGDSTVDMFLEIDEATLDCDIKTNECQLCFTYADKIPIAGAHQSIGGNAANVAVGAQKLGLQAAIVSEVGDDLNGLMIEDTLERSGVDTSYLRTNKRQETRYAVVLNYKGERTILSYHAPRTYHIPRIPHTKALYFTSLGKTFERVQRAVSTYKKRHSSVLLACNPGSYQCGKGLVQTRTLLPLVDLLFVNKEEAQKLTNTTSDVPELITHLHTIGVGMVVVTDGHKGSYASNGTHTYTMSRFPVSAISRTGAGDAYASGFLAAHLQGQDIETAMRWGTANAASVVQQFGGQTGLLTEKKLFTLIKKYSSIKPKLLA